MTYLLAHYWLPILLALLVGLWAGWTTFDCQCKQREGWPGWHKAVVGLWVLGVILALLKWLPGAPGLWLETAVLILPGWFVGLWLGGLFAKSRCPEVTAPAAPVAAPKPAPVVAATKPEPVAAPVVTPKPAPTGATPVPMQYEGIKPAGMETPDNDAPDDLERINGIGPQNAKILHSLGIYHFSQIASWSDDNIKWVSSYLEFPGRVEREDWVGQAKHILQDPNFQPVPASVKRAEAQTAASTVDKAEGAVEYEGTKPMALAGPEQGVPDTLERIDGIGPKYAELLHSLGVYHFHQISGWTGDNVKWLDSFLEFPGRIEREDWVGQAKKILADPTTQAVPASSRHGVDSSQYAGIKPVAFDTPASGSSDDLKRIKGIDEVNEKILNALGIWHFHQIADWSSANVEWINAYLETPGRVEREQWLAQAHELKNQT